MSNHLANHDMIRLAKQIDGHFEKIDEYARRIEKSDHPLKDNIIEALHDNQIFYTVDVERIIRKELDLDE